jgi:hypothetical protein
MPIPHQEMRRIIKRRIQGLNHAERIRVLQEALEQLPGYYQGPYGELRKWVRGLIAESETRRASTHHDSFFVSRQGDAQVVLAGAPNAGKSSLLNTLTGRHATVGDYAFTTLTPLAGMVAVNGASIQLVDLPGLIAAAHEGRGGGRAVLAAVKMADAVLLVAALTHEGVADAETARAELAAADIMLPLGLVATKRDLPGAEAALLRLTAAYPGDTPVVSSVAAGEGLEEVRQLIWRVSGLLRVYLKPPGRRAAVEPTILRPGATVATLVNHVNRAWLPLLRRALVTGPSAAFSRQTVGPDHRLADGDVVELQLS